MRCALPITKVTAMVSPSARPNPSMIAADDADTRVRHDHIPNDFPGRGAEPVAGFLEHRRHRVEHIAHGGGNERQHHDGEHHAGRENADAVGRAFEQVADAGKVAKIAYQPGLHMPLQHRREHEQPPDSEDDAGHRRQQFHGDADRALEQAAGTARSGTTRCRIRPARPAAWRSRR